jgi:hypothetical protein
VVFEIIDSHQRIFKSAMMAKLTITFNVLEDWEEHSENAAAPKAFKTNDVEWV